MHGWYQWFPFPIARCCFGSDSAAARPLFLFLSLSLLFFRRLPTAVEEALVLPSLPLLSRVIPAGKNAFRPVHAQCDIALPAKAKCNFVFSLSMRRRGATDGKKTRERHFHLSSAAKVVSSLADLWLASHELNKGEREEERGRPTLSYSLRH